MWLCRRRCGRFILHPDNGVRSVGQGQHSEILGVYTTFKFLLFWHHTCCIYFSNISSKCAEELKYSLPHRDNSRLNFSRYTHLAENTVKLTVTCVKFNYRPAVDALCVTQGDWRKLQPGGDPVGSSEHKSQWPGPLPRAGILPSHSPPTLQEQLMVTHHRHSPRVSLSQCTQVSRKGMQYTLLATSLYNSCPAPKIEYFNSTHCFIGGCKK